MKLALTKSSQLVTLNYSQRCRLASWIRARKQNVPLQYLLGSVPFAELPLEVKCRRPILIPRHETEQWVMWLVSMWRKEKDLELRGLDLGTGTGCISLALAHHFPQFKMVGVDCNEKAISLAIENKNRLQLQNVDFVLGDIFSSDLLQLGKFDFIVSNPPYISKFGMGQLPSSVRNYEDKNALAGGDDGLKFIRRILEIAPLFLFFKKSIPKIFVEFEGDSQLNCLTQLLESCKQKQLLSSYSLHKDYFGSHRWFCCTIHH